MGEIDPTVGPALVRQHLARQFAESTQRNIPGENAFGGAKFAANTFGNPIQEQTILGAIDQAAPMASRDVRDLVEALRATGQREAAGSNTAFNNQINEALTGGNVGQAAASSLNVTRIPGMIGKMVDDWTMRSNSEKLADFLLADPEAFRRGIQTAPRPVGGTRARIANALLATQGEQ